MAGPGRNAAFAVLAVETGLAWLVVCPLPALGQESAGRASPAAVGTQRAVQGSRQATAPHTVPDVALPPQVRGYQGSDRRLPGLAFSPASVAPAPLRGQSGNAPTPTPRSSPAANAALGLHPPVTAFAQRFGHGLGAMRIALEFAPSRAFSSIRAEDHGKIAARKTAEPLDIEGDIALLSESLAESHRYRDRDPISFIKHRNLRLAKYIGFDLADALDMRESWLHDLSLGVEWPKIKAVVPDSDRSNPAAPAITMGIAF